MKLIALAAASFVAFAAAPAMAQTAAPTSNDPSQADDPRGGYEPTQPLFSAQPAPGQTVIFVPNTQTPTEAYPPPAPAASYPICKRGQYDNCRQRGG